MAFTLAQLQPFIEHVDRSYNSNNFKQSIAAVVEYLTGNANALSGVNSDYNNSNFSYLHVLLKLPREWDQNDQLVLDAVTEPKIWQYARRGFTNLMARQVDEKGTEEDWNILITFLEKHIPLIEVFQSILDATIDLYNLEKMTTKNTLSAKWLRTYLRTAEKNTVVSLVKQNSHNAFNPNFLGLLMECTSGGADAYLNYNLQNGQQFNSYVIYPALYYNTEKYLPYIIEKLTEQSLNKTSGSVENRFFVLNVLKQKHPEAVKDLFIQVASDYLDLYVSMEHKGWEQQIKDGEVSYVVSGLATKILLEADPAGTKEKLWDIIQQTRFLHFTVLKQLVERFGEEALPFVLKALQADVSISGVRYHQLLFDLLKQFNKDKYNEALWGLVTHKSKQIRQVVLPMLIEDEKAIEKCTALLNHKSADTRQTAAQLLGMMPSPGAKEVLQKAIANEKNDDARDIMLQAVADELYNEVNDEMLAQLIKEAGNRGKLAKPMEDWLAEDSLPALYYTNGKQLSHDEVRFLLYRMSRVKAMRSDVEARLIINKFDKEKAADFALHLIKLFIDKGTKAEHKYLLALSALLGNEMVADKIRINIDKWIEDSRFKMAEYGVGALALQGSNKALRWVELYSRKYRAKKANVGASALAALEAAAEELNITVYELGDRIVPDFGFDGLFKQFTIDGENYRAFIDSNFKIAFFNDDNKKLKAIPSNADAELKDEFKAIAKEVRDVVKSQSSRLEHYLVVQRRWNKAQWEQFFLTNPVMFIYATKLLWGIYENNSLKQCFYCQEDTTLMDLDDNEMAIEDDAQIGIVHPLQLSEADLKKWQHKFFELSIEPVFSQLDRVFYVLAPEDKQVTIVRKYNEVKTESGAIRSTLDKYGWRKGQAMDGGTLDTFFKDDYAGEIMAVLNVEGVSVSGFDTDYDPKLGILYFRNRPIDKNQWLSEPKDDNDPALIPLGNLPEVFYSEVIAAIKAIKLKGV
ncbi:MAG TPA: DUF4132 domain-containing protein [Niastella sp.]